MKLQPCVSGPASVVSYYCFDPEEMGDICDWVKSDSVSCGEAATDYAIYKTITIPKEAEQLETRFGSFLTIKVKAIIGGEEECGADYNSYGMAASFAGAALLLGLVVAVGYKKCGKQTKQWQKNTSDVSADCQKTQSFVNANAMMSAKYLVTKDQ